MKKDKTGSPGSVEFTIGGNTYSPTLKENYTDYKLDYVLKSYMPYAARYVHKDDAKDIDIDVTVNYTLDNYMNIMGNVNDVYYAKTGYLINPDTIADIKVYDENGNIPQDINGNNIDMEYLIGTADGTKQGINEDEAEELCLSGRYRIELIINCKSSTNSTVDTLKIVSDPRSLDSGGVFNISGAREDEIQSQLKADYSNWHDNSYGHDTGIAANKLNRIQTEESELANMRAVAYYVRNVIFSRWVYNNLKDIQACDIQNTIINNTVNQYLSSIGNDYSNKAASVDTLFKVFDGDTSNIFGIRNQDTDLESPFTNHKDGVIRNSIQYNLDLAFSAYTKMYSGYLTFQMPVISDSEWGRIINNVSIVSFMQGMPCGTKNFSSYSIVNSTNNELTVIPSEIYYVPTDEFNNQNSAVHRVDCEDFSESNNISYEACSKYISVKSNNMKYDGIYNKNKSMYEYSFRNLLDYSCIINKNLRESNYLIGGTNDRVQRLDPQEWNDDDPSKRNSSRRLAYYTGIAEQRQKLYKTNALRTSGGYTYALLDNMGPTSHLSTSGTPSSGSIEFNLPTGKSLKDVKEFEIYFKTFQVSNSTGIEIEVDAEDGTDSVHLELFSKDGGYDDWVRRRVYHNLSSLNGSNLTIRARCHCTSNTTSNSIKLVFKENDPNVWIYSADCLGVKVIYK